jgi:hypothetical protein
MKTITRRNNLFKYDELSQDAKDTAISNEIAYFIDCVNYDDMSDAMRKACDKAESMRTPWFVGEYIYDYCKEEIEDCMRFNDYDFLPNGKVS